MGSAMGSACAVVISTAASMGSLNPIHSHVAGASAAVSRKANGIDALVGGPERSRAAFMVSPCRPIGATAVGGRGEGDGAGGAAPARAHARLDRAVPPTGGQALRRSDAHKAPPRTPCPLPLAHPAPSPSHTLPPSHTMPPACAAPTAVSALPARRLCTGPATCKLLQAHRCH